MARVRPYYQDASLSAAFYDVVTGADRRLAGDAEVYAGLAPTGGTVLELGTGSGRVAFALAERGLCVTGVDIAPAMLAQARRRLSTAPAEIVARLAFRQGDMTALDLKQTFDLVISPYFTLAHIPSGAAWRNAFNVMTRHLAADGRVAVHLPLADLMGAPAPDPDRVVLDEPLPGGGRLQLQVHERNFRSALGRMDQVIRYVERDAAGRLLRESLERLTYYTADPQPFAEAAGLVVEGSPTRIGEVGDIWVFRRP